MSYNGYIMNNIGIVLTQSEYDTITESCIQDLDTDSFIGKDGENFEPIEIDEDFEGFSFIPFMLYGKLNTQANESELDNTQEPLYFIPYTELNPFNPAYYFSKDKTLFKDIARFFQKKLPLDNTLIESRIGFVSYIVFG